MKRTGSWGDFNRARGGVPKKNLGISKKSSLHKNSPIYL